MKPTSKIHFLKFFVDLALMAAFDSNFFLNLELDSSEEEMDSTVQTVFQNEMSLFTKDNSDYVKKLREQIERVDSLKKGK